MRLKILSLSTLAFLTIFTCNTAAQDAPVISQNMQVNEYLDKAAQARSTGDINLAVSSYQKAIEIEPKNYLLHRNLGILFYEGQNYLEALKALKRSNDLKPNEPYTLLFIARVMMKTGDPETALDYLESAEKFLPDDAEIQIARGDALSQLRKIPDAEKTYEYALLLEPNHPKATMGLGKLYYTMKQYGKAQMSFEEAAKYAPGSSDLWYNLGMTYFAQNNLDKAAECMHRSLSLNPNDPQAFNALGMIFQKARIWDLAEKSYRKALEINPEYEKAQKNLDSLVWKKQEVMTGGFTRPGSYTTTNTQRPIPVSTTTSNPSPSHPENPHKRPGYDPMTGYNPQTGYVDTTGSDPVDSLTAAGKSIFDSLFGRNE